MPQVKVLVADDDLNMHQVIEDIVEICFRDVQIDRVMSSPAFVARLREDPNAYDIILFDLHLHQPSGSRALPSVLTEFPSIRGRLVVIAPADEDVDVVAEARDLPRVGFPFSLDDFTETVRKVYEAREEGAGPSAEGSAGQ